MYAMLRMIRKLSYATIRGWPHRGGGTAGKPQATAVIVQSEDQSEANRSFKLADWCGGRARVPRSLLHYYHRPRRRAESSAGEWDRRHRRARAENRRTWTYDLDLLPRSGWQSRRWVPAVLIAVSQSCRC